MRYDNDDRSMGRHVAQLWRYLLAFTLLTCFLLFFLLRLMPSSRPSTLSHAVSLGELSPQVRDSLVAEVRWAVRQEVLHLGRLSPEGDNLLASLPTIYVITPTYKRQEQLAEMTRLAQTLQLVPNVFWVVADDSATANDKLLEYLEYTRIPYTYMLTPMPDKYRNDRKIKSKPRGVSNRNGALQWIRQHATEGVLYFADDDNTYDVRLFSEMRYTKKVSMWPVGLVTKWGVSTPILRKGRYAGWFDGWIAKRTFAVDMASFAVSVDLLLKNPEAKMPFKAGYEEDSFLKSLNIKPEDIEFKANGCTKIYVWHTQTKKNSPAQNHILSSKYDDSNLKFLRNQIIVNATDDGKPPPKSKSSKAKKPKAQVPKAKGPAEETDKKPQKQKQQEQQKQEQKKQEEQKQEEQKQEQQKQEEQKQEQQKQEEQKQEQQKQEQQKQEQQKQEQQKNEKQDKQEEQRQEQQEEKKE